MREFASGCFKLTLDWRLIRWLDVNWLSGSFEHHPCRLNGPFCRFPARTPLGTKYFRGIDGNEYYEKEEEEEEEEDNDAVEEEEEEEE